MENVTHKPPKQNETNPCRKLSGLMLGGTALLPFEDLEGTMLDPNLSTHRPRFPQSLHCAELPSHLTEKGGREMENRTSRDGMKSKH